MKKLVYPDFSKVPKVNKQKAITKKINSGKYLILKELLLEFLFYLHDKDLINNHDFDYEKEAKKFLKKVGQK